METTDVHRKEAMLMHPQGFERQETIREELQMFDDIQPFLNERDLAQEQRQSWRDEEITVPKPKQRGLIEGLQIP